MITRYLKSPAWHGVGDSIVGQVRKANEDNCGYQSTPNGELFVVCDGMGGHVGGATASRIAVDSIIAFLSQQEWQDKPQAIAEALRFANTQILGTAANDATLKGMGTTACIVLCEGQDVWIGHVGDSRIYLFDKRNAYLHRISKDHSYVQALVDKGELDDRDAENHPQKNIIMRALGSKEEVVPDVEAIPLHIAAGDTILICSDGLSGMIDDNEIEAILASKLSLEDKAEKLINDANAPGKGKDNITVQLIQAVSSAFKQSTFPDFNPKWRQRETKKKKSPWFWGAIITIILALLAAGSLVGYKLISGDKPLMAFTTDIQVKEKGDNLIVRCSAKINKVRPSNEDSETLQENVISVQKEESQLEDNEPTSRTESGSKKAETVAQIQARIQQAKNHVTRISSYELSLKNNKESVAAYAREMEDLIKKLPGDTTKANELLTLLEGKFSEANKKLNESATTRSNIEPILGQLKDTKVEEEINKAKELISKYDKYNKEIGTDIQKMDEHIKTLKAHIKSLKAANDKKKKKQKENEQSTAPVTNTVPEVETAPEENNSSNPPAVIEDPVIQNSDSTNTTESDSVKVQ